MLLLLGIIMFHVGMLCPNIKRQLLVFFCTQRNNLAFGVELFFVIGGYFLYSSIKKNRMPVSARISKLWQRLIPGLLFVFFCQLILGVSDWWRFAVIAAGVPGTGLTPTVTTCGDWYIATFFLTSCLITSILEKGKGGLFPICVLLYLTLCLRVHGTWKGGAVNGTWNSVVSEGMVRAIAYMSLGVLTAFLSEVITLRKNAGIRIICTVIECAAIYVVSNFMLRTSCFRFSSLDASLLFAFALISSYHGYGYISSIFNKLKWFAYVSRYSYSIFLCHAVFAKFLSAHKGFGIPEAQQAIIVGGGGVFYWELSSII